MALLEVRDLSIRLVKKRAAALVVEGLSLTLAKGRCLAIVGESGSGKSTAALAIAGLLSDDLFDVTGEIRLDGRDLRRLSKRDLRTVQGNQIAMVFQDPMSSLNPVQRIGDQIVECIRAHRAIARKAAAALAVETLDRVGMPDPASAMRRYPHQLSGGQRQRVMIAMAVVTNPKLLIADEPTTALDLTIQAQILSLLTQLAGDLGMAVLLITHDFGVVAEMSDDVVVLYAGRDVEAGPTDVVLEHPAHPYTRGLLAAHPTLEGPAERLLPIPGAPPGIWERPVGCAFHNRCASARPICAEEAPPHVSGAHPDHRGACVLLAASDGQAVPT